jgi:hypothetical protein
MHTTKTRIGVALSVSVAVVASLAGTAGARIPQGEVDGAAQTQPEPSSRASNLGLYLPLDSGLNSIDSWISQQMTRRAAALEANFAGPEAVARAIARRNR